MVRCQYSFSIWFPYRRCSPKSVTPPDNGGDTGNSGDSGDTTPETPESLSIPTADNSVAEIKTYLDANGIEYKANATKNELLSLV